MLKTQTPDTRHPALTTLLVCCTLPLPFSCLLSCPKLKQLQPVLVSPGIDQTKRGQEMSQAQVRMRLKNQPSPQSFTLVLSTYQEGVSLSSLPSSVLLPSSQFCPLPSPAFLVKHSPVQQKEHVLNLVRLRTGEPGIGALLCQALDLPRGETQPVYVEQPLSQIGMRMTLLALPTLELQDLSGNSSRGIF